MVFFIYILYSEKCDKYYVGHTHDIDIRIQEHNTGKGGKFSKNCIPWKLMYSETYPSRKEAIQRERSIKNKKSRKYLELLINEGASRP
jgi:putative endonuclease